MEVNKIKVKNSKGTHLSSKTGYSKKKKNGLIEVCKEHFTLTTVT